MPLGHPVKTDLLKAFPCLFPIRWMDKDNGKPKLTCTLIKTAGRDGGSQQSHENKEHFLFFFLVLSFIAFDLLQATSTLQKTGRKTDRRPGQRCTVNTSSWGSSVVLGRLCFPFNLDNLNTDAKLPLKHFSAGTQRRCCRVTDLLVWVAVHTHIRP